MSIWFQKPKLDPSERVTFESAANAFMHRLIGGRLTVTDARVLFTPNRLDGLFGAKPVQFGLPEIRKVEILRPGKAAVLDRGFGAAVRHQVEISYRDGESIIVTVRDRDGLLAAIRQG